jgi:protein-S-isoprenylcysteine O-methyltransferase Ste14
MAFVVLLGGAIAVGSWAVVLALAVARVFGHFSIVAEEEACAKRYGDSYREYLQRVPRYFLFF